MIWVYISFLILFWVIYSRIKLFTLTLSFPLNISALFLPGTVFASFSQADIAGTVDSEFYFKRTFGDVYTPVVYPYFNSLTSGLRFGKSKKSKKFKLIDSDIKYLLKK